MGRKPRLAVFKFASCDGCQLSLLDLENELLAIGEALEIAYFLEASRRVLRGPYDIGLVEGSISTPHDLEYIKKVRQRCRKLVTIGACATAGGIQALRNWKGSAELIKYVYPTPEYLETLDKSTPISEHVSVDFELRGCPINKYQLLEVISAFLAGRAPNIPNHSVCIECKLNGNVCIMVAKGVPCLGPVTQAGCGALCPSYSRGCYGCYGPKESANTSSLSKHFIRLGRSREETIRFFHQFNAWASEFRKVEKEVV